ncbi:hypothetical protein FSP39_003572 [Pinctada imbricata]|uniref:Uncharacterized protein n=1 Tax=Pinctada imbricata TaxID=66713 RepID=A0AA89BKJ6_PINIB|nr:hypothetical protein FSP39_003572 [Pinctada imbricata]
MGGDTSTLLSKPQPLIIHRLSCVIQIGVSHHYKGGWVVDRVRARGMGGDTSTLLSKPQPLIIHRLSYVIQIRIHQCTPDNDCKKSVKPECMWDSENDQNDCYKKYGYCSMYKGCGTCAWIRSREFYNCEDGVNVQ